VVAFKTGDETQLPSLLAQLILNMLSTHAFGIYCGFKLAIEKIL